MRHRRHTLLSVDFPLWLAPATPRDLSTSSAPFPTGASDASEGGVRCIQRWTEYSCTRLASLLSKPPLACTFYHSAYAFKTSTIKHCHPQFLPKPCITKLGLCNGKSLGLDMFDSALRLLNCLFLEHIPYQFPRHRKTKQAMTLAQIFVTHTGPQALRKFRSFAPSVVQNTRSQLCLDRMSQNPLVYVAISWYF